MENTENEKVKSRKELMLARMQEKYPDKNFSDEESIYGQIYDDYDDYDGRIKGYEEREKALTDMFARDERSAKFLMDWKNGANPWLELIREYGVDGLKEILEDEDRAKEVSEANEDYLKRVAENKKLEEEYNKNLSESLELIDKKQSEDGLSDEQIDKAMELLLQIVHDGVQGKFSSESIDMALKAIYHDADVEEASADAEIRGRNAKITETLRKRAAGDGTAVLDGKNNTAPKNNKRYSIFDEARGAS